MISIPDIFTYRCQYPLEDRKVGGKVAGFERVVGIFDDVQRNVPFGADVIEDRSAGPGIGGAVKGNAGSGMRKRKRFVEGSGKGDSRRQGDRSCCPPPVFQGFLYPLSI